MTSKLKKIPKSKIYNLSYLVLAVLLLLTIGITYIFYTTSRNKDVIRFTNQTKRLKLAIENRINLYVALLEGTRGFVEVSPELNNERFSTYIKSLDLENNYPGVQGIGFTETFRAAEKENLERRMAAEGFPNFKVFPESDEQVRQAIVYIQPLNERNQRALGFDMSTERTRRAALDRARETGKPIATGKVRLIQEREDEDVQDGFLIYMPVFKSKIPPDTPEKQIADLRGYVYSPFRAGNFLSEVYNASRDVDIGVKIYDDHAGAESLLAQTQQVVSPVPIQYGNEVFLTRETIEVAERKWIVEFNSLPSFAQQSNVVWTPLIFFCGICFSFLLFGMTYWEAVSREKLQNYAADLVDLQSEREILFENESKARKLAEEANVAKDEFISIVSHELKTPLNTIAGWARIIKTDDISKQTRELALTKIDKNLRLQARLVEQLLSYSELISNSSNLPSEKIDLPRLIAEVAAENEAAAIENEISLTNENSAGEAYVSGDGEKLRLVFNNLFSNALKFTPKGGKIHTKITREDDSVRFEIADTGRGIDAASLPLIFESYKQADNPNVRDYGGLGLGLAVSKHIVKLHSGSIEVNSKGRGEGAVFTVKLPALKDLT